MTGPVYAAGAIEFCVPCVLVSRTSWKYAYGAIGAVPALVIVVADVDHVAVAVEGERLDHLVAVGRGGLQLQFEHVRAGGELARPGYRFV